MKSVSVIIPALNEERFIGATLQLVHEAVRTLPSGHDCHVQIIVVDNASEDQTAAAARRAGATVVSEPIRHIARARNTGARMADGEVLFFLDADTLVPNGVLTKVSTVMSVPGSVGGALDVRHCPSRASVRLYLRFWRAIGQACGMAQGAAQFWDRAQFLSNGGYDETIYMGEDVEFYWRMKRVARRQGRKLYYISDMQVIPSPRRFDRWPLWKTLLWTNPALVVLLRHRKSAWRGWYENVPR